MLRRLLTTAKGQGLQLQQYTHAPANPLLWGRLLRAIERRRSGQSKGARLLNRRSSQQSDMTRALRFRPLAGVSTEQQPAALWEQLPAGDPSRLDEVPPAADVVPLAADVVPPAADVPLSAAVSALALHCLKHQSVVAA